MIFQLFNAIGLLRQKFITYVNINHEDDSVASISKEKLCAGRKGLAFDRLYDKYLLSSIETAKTSCGLGCRTPLP